MNNLPYIRVSNHIQTDTLIFSKKMVEHWKYNNALSSYECIIHFDMK